MLQQYVYCKIIPNNTCFTTIATALVIEGEEILKKSWKILIVLLLVLVIGGSVLDFVLSATDDKTTVNWEAYAIFIAVVIAVALARILTVRSKITKLFSAYQNKNYDKVIEMQSTANIIGLRQVQQETIWLVVAVSYLELGNTQEFYKIIGKVNSDILQNRKILWQAICCFSQNDSEGFFLWQQALQNNPNETDKQKALGVLDVLVKAKNRQPLNEEEKNLINALHSALITTLVERASNGDFNV